MIYSKPSTYSPDEIATRLGEAAARHKFGILHVHDLRQTLDAKGIQLGADCRVYDVCNPHAAATALRADMRVSAVLPCRISVFTQPGGSLISTVLPFDLFAATGLQGAEDLAAEVQRELIAIIDETA
jgi:uncharacterized protein (DUF302 family)